ncbi:arf-GAP domain and FG repeat-containing protein 1 isoform X2 [Anopheles bellator]|uniref:arf-GAP domain and FG repeat-containing protein 1 isoform X2 n=1 Tax=Anopheles bellator TaxID=139047 RepID=UPI002648F1C1|nr:arf-GAP domain and FG repeat-containing protein 1 isoform X2 [Anopheles bellator]
MALVRKKLDDKILKTLRELVGVGGNKECFDCGQKGPTYINMTIGSFVCTSCSGILRGLTPPHRVKSISMATFTQEEIEFLKQNGNDNCGRTWLGLWDPKRAIKQEHRDFMIDKYERKRYYLEPASPLKSLPTNASSSLTSLTAAKNANESLVPLKTPTLTPPATLRLHRHNSGSCNGLNATVSASSSSLGTAAGCLTSQFQQQFTPDDSDFFGPAATVTADPPKILPPTPQKHPNLQRKNGIKMKKPAGGGELVGPTTYGRNQKNGLLNHSAATAFTGSSGDINANKFTPDGDFVADFGSATIISTVASNGGSHYGSASSLRNGGGALVGSAENGVYHNGVTANGGPASNGELENFADFDHNPIFNSAGLPVSAGLNGSHVNGGSNGNNMHTTTPSIDRYAALKDLDEQFREIKLEAESNNNGPLTALKASAGTSASDPHSHGPANPFKTANPFQQSPAAWPIAAPTNGSPVIGDPRHQPTNGTNGGFYATSPYQGGFVQPGSASHLYNGNVSASTGVTPVAGYHHPAAYHQNGNGYAMVGTNGAMMVNGSGGPQLLNNVPVHHFGNFGNPFMAAGTTAGHSNNPFL